MRHILSIFACLCLVACGVPDGPAVSVSQLAKYQLTAVEVDGEGIIRSWPAVEKAFLASGKADPATASRLDTEPASNFPALRTAIKQALQARLLTLLRRDAGTLFQGQRPVVARVTVLDFDVPSAGRRLLAGGNAVVKLKIDLVDPASREVLVAYPGQSATVFLAGGAIGAVAATMSTDDVGDELIGKAVALYVAWLKGQGEASF